MSLSSKAAGTPGRWEQQPDHGHVSARQFCSGSQALITIQAVRGSLGRGPGVGGTSSYIPREH